MSFERWFPHAILLAVAAVWLAIASGCGSCDPSPRGGIDEPCKPDGTCNGDNLWCAPTYVGAVVVYHRCQMKAGK